MKRFILSLILIISTSVSVQAQKKSELIAEISALKIQLDSVTNELSVAQRNEKSSLTKAESFETQALELREANKTLMKNLNSFSQLSTQNSSNMNKAMQQLNEKEQQLKAISDAIASNDSTAIVVLTNAKQTLGENAKIAVLNGEVIVSSSLSFLFKSDMESILNPEAEVWIQKIAQILVTNPDTNLAIEGLSMTGDLQLPAAQAASIGIALQKANITPDRITSLGRDGDLKEGVLLKIQPKFDTFYSMVKEHMKN